MMTTGGSLAGELSKKTSIFGLKVWVLIGVGVVSFIVLILVFLSIWLTSRKKSGLPSVSFPPLPKEIKEVKVDRVQSTSFPRLPEGLLIHANRSSRERNLEKDDGNVPYGIMPKHSLLKKANREVDWGVEGESDPERGRRSSWKEEIQIDKGNKVNSSFDRVIIEGEKRGLLASVIAESLSNASVDYPVAECFSPHPPPISTFPEVSHLGWGHWYTLRELETATNCFSDSNVIGEGGYGIVYQGQLPDGTLIAVKNLLNNRGQAEKEFSVEVEAIGRVRHKNLVRLLGYCAEGSHRMLVYEYMDNGNLDQWLHGHLGKHESIPWDIRMKLIIGTAKGLAYLHEGLEPKVVHRDVKSSNILVDSRWNAKVSDFGLAKMLGSERTHVTTRVMGTFGYVAPEYASTGLLNERSDVYSFGVLLMEVITGRDPVGHGRPAAEVNLVDWFKAMASHKRSEEVLDPKIEVKPTSRALKRAIVVALRCVDPDSHKRPKMGHVVHMLEADDFPFRDDRRVVRDSLRGRTSPRASVQGLREEPSYQ